MRWVVLAAAVLVCSPAGPGFADERPDLAQLPAQMRALSGADADARAQAQAALVATLLFDVPRTSVIDEAARPSVDDVRAALGSNDGLTRILGAAAAARMGLDAKPLLDALLGHFGKRVFAYDVHVLEVLRKLGPDAASAAPILATAMHRYADHSMGRIDPAVPAIEGRDVGAACRASLHALGPAGLAALRESVLTEHYTRPVTRAVIAELTAVYDPKPEVERPPAPAPPPVEAPSVWLTRLEAEVAASGLPDSGSDASEWPHLGALWALRERATPALTHAVREGSMDVRKACLDVLAALGSKSATAADAIAEHISAADLGLQRRAVVALAACGTVRPGSLDDLIPLVGATHWRTRIGAVRAITQLGRAAAPAREAIHDALAASLTPVPPHLTWRDASPEFRASAVLALGAMRSADDATVLLILRVGASPDPTDFPSKLGRGGYRGPPWLNPRRPARTRVLAAVRRAITDLGVAALPAVRRGLASEDPATRTVAAHVLTQFDATAVMQDAIAASRDPHATVRQASLAALTKSDDPASLRALLARVGDADGAIGRAAIEHLGQMRARAEAAAPRLAALVLGGSSRARHALKALDLIRPDADLLHAPTLTRAVLKGTIAPNEGIWRLDQLGSAGVRAAPLLSSELAQMPPESASACLAFLAKATPDDAALHTRAIALSAHESAETRHKATSALAQVARNAESVPEAVITALGARAEDPDAKIALHAVFVLSELASAHAAARAPLRDALEAKHEQVRAYAVRGLADAEPPEEAAGVAMALLASEDKKVRQLGVEAIAEIGGVAAARPTLEKMLAHDEAHIVRMRLPAAIASTGPEGVRAMRERMRSLPHRSQEWYQTRNALSYGGAGVVEELRGWLASRDLATYYAAASMLRTIGRDAVAAVPDLFALAQSGKPQARMVATEALMEIIGLNERVLQLIAATLRGDVLERNASARLLASVDDAGLTKLRAAVRDCLPRMRGQGLLEVLAATRRLGKDAAALIPTLVSCMPGAASHERMMIATTIGQLGIDSAPAHAALRWALRDPRARVRRAAAVAIAEGYRGNAALVELAGGRLEDVDGEVRSAVAAGLADIGPDARPALPALVRAAASRQGEAMRDAFRALHALDPGGDMIRPFLLRLAQGDDPWRAHAALLALGHASGELPQVDALLASSAKHWDWRIRAGAQAGLDVREAD